MPIKLKIFWLWRSVSRRAVLLHGCIWLFGKVNVWHYLMSFCVDTDGEKSCFLDRNLSARKHTLLLRHGQKRKWRKVSKNTIFEFLPKILWKTRKKLGYVNTIALQNSSWNWEVNKNSFQNIAGILVISCFRDAKSW